MQAAPENLARALESMPENLKEEDGPSSSYMANLPSHQSMNSVQNSVSNGNESGGGSCCSSTPAVTSPPSSSAQSTSQTPSWNHTTPLESEHSWSTPVAPASNGYMSFDVSSPAQQIYMSNYNSPTSIPTTPFPSLMSGLGISDPSVNPYTTSPQDPSFNPAALFGNDGCGTECQCGDDCQCLGCAAHPFNNTTRERVQEMGVLMIDGQNTSPNNWQSVYAGGYFPTSNNGVPQPAYQPNPYTDQPYANSHPPVVNAYVRPLAPPEPQNNDGLMHPAEYHTLTYPVGISCSDVTGSCQCGSDCSCIGCLTHTGHTGVPSAKTPFEELSDQPAEQESSSCCGPPSSRANLPVTSMI